MELTDIASFYVGSGGGKYTKWTVLGNELHREISEMFFCESGLPEVAKRTILERADLSQLYYEYGSEETEISWVNTIQKNVKMAGRRGGAKAQNREIINTARKAMVRAYEYYLMYGMVPCYIESVEDRATGRKRYEIGVPQPNTGRFVARRTPGHGIEVGWRWDRRYTAGQHSYKVMPDDAVYVHVWEDTVPWMDGVCPFRSIIPKLIYDWRRRNGTWGRHERGEINSVNPRLIVQGQATGASLDQMQPSEMYNDMLHDGDLTKSFQHAADSRASKSFQSRLDDALSVSIQQFVPDHQRITQDDGRQVVQDVNTGEDLRVVTLPPGTSTGTYPLPKTSNLVPLIDEWWAGRVSAFMRVPIDILMGRQTSSRTAREAEISADTIDVSVRGARTVMKDFIETAWAILFRDMEDEMIDLEEQNIAEMENMERATVVDYLKHLVVNDPTDPDIPAGTTMDKLDSIDANTGMEELIAEPTGEGAAAQENPGTEGATPQTVASRLERIAFSQMERLRKIESIGQLVGRHASSVGIPLDEGKLREEVTKVVYFMETGRYNAELRRTKIAGLKKTGNRFKIGYFSQTFLTSDQISDLAKDGTISQEVEHTLKMMKNNLPLDTPRGESPTDLQIRLMQEKSRLVIEESREKSKLAIQEAKEKAKLAVQDAKEKAKLGIGIRGLQMPGAVAPEETGRGRKRLEVGEDSEEDRQHKRKKKKKKGGHSEGARQKLVV